MSHSKRCPHPTCCELIPLDAMDCGGHAEETPHKCLDCPATVYGKSTRCEKCKIALRKEVQKRYRMNIAPPPRPHRALKVDLPAKPILLTDAEQEAINEEAIRREAARVDRIHREMGLVARAGRPLASDLIPVSPEEIKRLERQYLPPARKEGSRLAPWCVFGGV